MVAGKCARILTVPMLVFVVPQQQKTRADNLACVFLPRGSLLRGGSLGDGVVRFEKATEVFFSG